MTSPAATEPAPIAARVRELLAALPLEARALMRADNDRDRAKRDALIAFAVRVASAGLLYLSQIVMARWIGGFDYGIYVAVWTWVLILGGTAHLGLNLSVIRLVPEHRERGEHALLRGLLIGSRAFALGMGTLVALAGGLGLWLLEPYVANHFVLPAYLALVCVPLYAMTDVQDGIGRGHGWMAIGLVPPYVLRPLLVLTAMAAAHLYGLPMTAATAAGAAILATWTAGVVQLVLINRRAGEAWRESHGNGERQPRPQLAFRAWMRVSLPLVLISACELALQNTDVLVISRYLTPTDVGIYFAAGKTMSLILFVHYAVGSAVANRFAALNARGDKEALRAFVRDSVNWTFWPSLLGAVAILALGKPLLWLFGPQFQAGYPVMFILVIGFLVRSSMGPAEFILNMLGEQALCAAVLVVTAFLNLALNFALVPNFGLVGAASATSLSLVTASALNYIVAKRRLEIEIGIWSHLTRK